MVLINAGTRKTQKKRGDTQMSETKNLTHSMASQNSATKQPEEKSPSTPISVSLATHLFELAKTVTKNDVNPQTVRAACECASEIHKLLELQIKAKRLS